VRGRHRTHDACQFSSISARLPPTASTWIMMIACSTHPARQRTQPASRTPGTLENRRGAMRACTVAVTLLGMLAHAAAQWVSLRCIIQHPGCELHLSRSRCCWLRVTWGRCVRAVPPQDNPGVASLHPPLNAGLCNNQTAFDCGDCRAGYYKDNGRCLRCPAGSRSEPGNKDDKQPATPAGAMDTPDLPHPSHPPAHPSARPCRRYH
jgi:hypothetical protein